jgi:hypothetical protein
VTENVSNVLWNIVYCVLNISIREEAPIIIRSQNFLFEKIAGKNYHSVLWKEHFRSSLLCFDNYVLEAEDERLQHRCTLPFRHIFLPITKQF